MIDPFEFTSSPAHIIFGVGSLGACRRGGPVPGLRAGHRAVDTGAGAKRRGSCGAAGRSLRRHVLRRGHAHTGRGHGARARHRQGPRRRLHRGARRRINHRPRQGACLSHGPAADRHPDHLCRLRSNSDPGSDRGRREDHAQRPQDPAGSCDLRPGADHRPAARHDGDQRAQRSSPMRSRRSMPGTATRCRA